MIRAPALHLVPVRSCLRIGLIAVSTFLQAQSPSPAADLEIFSQGFPRVVNFRVESRLTSPHVAASSTFFETLDGLVMKPLDEELAPDFGGGNRDDWLGTFAAANPSKVYLAHFNHYGWQPLQLQQIMPFPGHYFYREATAPAADIQPTDTAITVTDLSRILYLSRGSNIYNPHALIIRTDAQGNRLWAQAEYIKILSIDTSSSMLTIQRNAIPWAPLPLPKWPADGHTQVAAAITEFDIDGQGGKFSVNYSTNCPMDAQGRTATDVVINYLATEFSPSGRCARAHGIAFDAPFEKPFSASKFRPDLNNDGSGADDLAENHESYTLGLYRFFQRLRERMGPGFILTADSRDDAQRAVGIFNGMEAEGFPDGPKDPYLLNWSTGFNLFDYWKRARSQPIEASFAHLKDSSGTFPVEADRPKHLTRLALAGVVCNAVPASAMFLPNPDGTPFATNLWDEGTRGLDGVHNWLGAPRGPIVRLAMNSTDLFAGGGVALTTAFVNQFNSPDATITKAGDHLRIRHNGTAQSDHELDVNLIVNSNAVAGRTGDLLLRFQIEADARPGYAEFGDVPRNAFVRIFNSGIVTSDTAAELLTFAGAVPFAEATFYYRGALPLAAGQNLRFAFRFEGLGDVRLKNFVLHHAPDALLREFSNGVVLCNPSLQTVTFDLASLLPGMRFRRIQGQFDPAVNDGSTVTDPAAVNVPARDALFLVKLPLSTANDSDDDGLLDAWELRLAPDLSTLGLAGQPASGKDSDGDGRSDAAEQADGTHPLESTSALRTVSVEMVNEELRWRFDAQPGCFYRIQSSTDLRTWQLWGGSQEATGAQMDCRVPLASSGSQPFLFFRAFIQ